MYSRNIQKIKLFTKYINLLMLVLTVGSLCSCSNPHKKHEKHDKKISQDIHNSGKNNVDLESQLINASKSIERSLAVLAMAQEASHPPILNTAPLVTPEGGMGNIVNIDWAGPIEPLLEKVATMSGYHIKVLGSAPAIPIIVSISQQKAVVADILKNASLQAGKRATVLAFPANRVVELRYAS